MDRDRPQCGLMPNVASLMPTSSKAVLDVTTSSAMSSLTAFSPGSGVWRILCRGRQLGGIGSRATLSSTSLPTAFIAVKVCLHSLGVTWRSMKYPFPVGGRFVADGEMSQKLNFVCFCRTCRERAFEADSQHPKRAGFQWCSARDPRETDSCFSLSFSLVLTQ